LAWLVGPTMGDQAVMVIGTSYSPPLSTSEKDGYFDLLLSQAFARLGMETKMTMLPAERSLQEANNGHLDGDVGRVKAIGDLYHNLVRVPEPVLDKREFTAFFIGRDLAIHDWGDLAPYNVGMVRGWKIFENNAVDVKSSIRVDDTGMLFTALKKGRIDVALSARLDGLAMAKKLGIRDIRVAEPALAEKQMFLYLHKSHNDIVAAVSDAFESVKQDGAAARIKNRVERKYIEF
jgi:polar amino acid transport system substrate-binding protein